MPFFPATLLLGFITPFFHSPCCTALLTTFSSSLLPSCFVSSFYGFPFSLPASCMPACYATLLTTTTYTCLPPTLPAVLPMPCTHACWFCPLPSCCCPTVVASLTLLVLPCLGCLPLFRLLPYTYVYAYPTFLHHSLLLYSPYLHAPTAFCVLLCFPVPCCVFSGVLISPSLSHLLPTTCHWDVCCHHPSAYPTGVWFICLLLTFLFHAAFPCLCLPTGSHCLSPTLPYYLGLLPTHMAACAIPHLPVTFMVVAHIPTLPSGLLVGFTYLQPCPYTPSPTACSPVPQFCLPVPGPHPYMLCLPFCLCPSLPILVLVLGLYVFPLLLLPSQFCWVPITPMGSFFYLYT